MRFGVQLFGPGNFCRSNPDLFFKALSECHYQLIEPCVWLIEVPEDAKVYPIWTIDEMTTYKPLFEKYKLKIRSCHIFTGIQNVQNDSEIKQLSSKIQKIHDDFGITDFIFAGHSETTKEGCQIYSEKLKKLSNSISNDSIRLVLHNNCDESVAKIDGQSAFEFLLKNCEGRIKAQVDVGWLFYGQIDVESFLWRNKELIVSLHYKDFAKKDDGKLEETVVGNGLVDVKSCFQFCRAMGLPQYVDIDKYEEGQVVKILEDVKSLFDGLTQIRDNTESILCIFNTVTNEVKKLREFDFVIEAPNWLKDGDTIIYNSEGHIYKYSISDDKEEMIQTGQCNNCNNDHVPSPDCKQIAVSHSKPGTWISKIYIVPIEGGEPKLITPNAPSFLHGWSHDGSEMAYCAFRECEGKLAVDVWSIPVHGGDERQLTKNCGFNDGPEYDPDGKHIWFNSTRTGLMQIWRMMRNGSDQQQMTFEEQNNWFGHVSPDGKKVVNLAYSKDGLDAHEHLPNMNVSLWMMDYDGKNRKKILDFFGGQGSINVNSWSPDSKQFAFVSYELKHK